MLFRVEVDGLNEMSEEWARGCDALVEDLRDVVSSTCATVEREAKKEAPVDTGELRDSIDTQNVRRSKHGGSGEVVVKADHATFVVEGTRPHEIVPKTAAALRWQTPAGPRFAKRVQHPGTQPNNFLDVAQAAGERTAERGADVAVASLAARVEG